MVSLDGREGYELSNGIRSSKEVGALINLIRIGN